MDTVLQNKHVQKTIWECFALEHCERQNCSKHMLPLIIGHSQSPIQYGPLLTNIHSRFGTMSQMPLHYAAESGFIEAVRVCLQNNANLNAFDKNSTPLFLAVSKKPESVIIVRMLVEAGADIELGNVGTKMTPLLEACDCGNLDVVKYLVEKGANLHARDSLNTTVIGIVCRSINCEVEYNTNVFESVVDVLLFILDQQYPGLTLNEPNIGGTTPLQYLWCGIADCRNPQKKYATITRMFKLLDCMEALTHAGAAMSEKQRDNLNFLRNERSSLIASKQVVTSNHSH